jgi:hypothetical protein
MFDELNRSIDEFMAKWQSLVGQRKNKDFFDRLKPTAVGWKVTDLAEFDRLFNQWREACDQIHVSRKNERWLATLHLKESTLHGDISVIKLMQRRPNSTDAVGLDHLDLMDMEETNTKAVLAEEVDIKWTDEENGLCVWTSIWFDGTEAKLREGTVLDVSIAELHEVNNKIRGQKFAESTEGGHVAYGSEVE